MEAELGPTEDPDVAPAYYAVVQPRTRWSPTGCTGGPSPTWRRSRPSAGTGVRGADPPGRPVLEAAPDVVLHMGDVVAVTGRRDAIVGEGLDQLGSEVDDPSLLDYRVETVGVAVTNKELDGQTVAQLRAGVLGRGVFVDRLVRAGVEVPWTAGTGLHRGDELHLTGLQSEVERAGQEIGFVERTTPQTDMVFVSLGIVLGALIGIPAITIGSVTLRLTTSVGALLAGLVFGWLRSVHPTFGRVPPAAQWFFDTVAFALSVGVIGINAGQDFVPGCASPA